MTKHLRRLCRFRLFAEASGIYRVRMTAPPVSAGSLRRLPVAVQQLHRELFERPADPAWGRE